MPPTFANCELLIVARADLCFSVKVRSLCSLSLTYQLTGFITAILVDRNSSRSIRMLEVLNALSFISLQVTSKSACVVN